MEYDLDMKQRKEDEKKGFNRFDAVFNNLEAEIDGLPNDEEDDEHDDRETAQGTERLNTTHSMRIFENNSMKITDMDEEIEFTKRTMKTEADQYDIDLKEEGDIFTTKGNRIQGNDFGSIFENLDTIVNSMQPDSFEEDAEIRPMPSTKITAQKALSTEPAKFPISCFQNISAEDAVAIEDRLHPLTAMLSLEVMEYELKNILEPCLVHPSIEPNIKRKLERKKESLEKQKKRFEDNFKSNKLNAKTLPPILENSLRTNQKLLDEVSKARGRKVDVQRIEIRIKILNDQIQRWNKEKPNNSRKVSRTSIPSKGHNSYKSLSEYSKNLDPEVFFNDYGKMSKSEQLKLLKARKAQHYNLAMYLKQEVAKFLPKKESDIVLERIKNKHIPLLQKANEIISSLENGSLENANEFLSRELHEVTPEELHGMSPSERMKAIRDIISKIEIAKADEANYSHIIITSTDKPESHAVQSKIRDAKRKISDYEKQQEILYKIEKDPWMYIPIVAYATESRTVPVINPDIPDLNTLIVEFLCVTKCPEKVYHLKYSIEADGKMREFKTNKCPKNGVWNYSNKIQLTSNPKVPDYELHNKEIQIIIYNSGYIWDSQKAVNKISLKQFQKTNTIRGKIFLDEHSKEYEVEYVLRIREPQFKTTKMPVSSVNVEKVFPRLEINAKLPESKNPPKNVPSQTQIQEVDSQSPSLQTKQQPIQESQQKAQADSSALVILKSAMNSIRGLDPTEIPAGCTPEDIMEPDNPEKNKCYAYLQELTKQLETAKQQMLAGFGNVSDSKYVREKWSVAFKELNLLEGKLSAGQIDITNYLQNLRNTIEKDKKLLNFYTAKGATGYINFMKAKIDIYEKEFSEMEAQMSGNQE